MFSRVFLVTVFPFSFFDFPSFLYLLLLLLWLFVVLLFCCFVLLRAHQPKKIQQKITKPFALKCFCAIVFRGLWAEKGQQTKGQPIIKCFFHCCCFVLVVRATTRTEKTKKQDQKDKNLFFICLLVWCYRLFWCLFCSA